MSESSGKLPKIHPEEPQTEVNGQMLLIPRPVAPGQLLSVLYTRTRLRGRAAERADRRPDLKPGLPRLLPASEGVEAQPLPEPKPELSESDLVRQAYAEVAPFSDTIIPYPPAK